MFINKLWQKIIFAKIGKFTPIQEQGPSPLKNKNIFISINNDIANLYIEENYTNVNIAIMVISIRVMIIKYNIQN